MKGSLIITAFFVLGLLAGQIPLNWDLVPVDDYMKWTLYTLMLMVGIGFGSDPRFSEILRSASLKIFLIPLTTILGTFAGVFIYTRFFHFMDPVDAFAVGAGFGYYSLSSILIGEFSGPEIAVIALLANVIREIITLLFTPVIVGYFGKVAPITSGGATSMDTTLPIILKVSGKNYLFASMLNGILLTILVPFIISFLYSIS